MTVKDLMDKLKELPQDAEVKRVITAEWGNIDVENVTVNTQNNSIIID